MFGSSLPPVVCRRAHVLFTFGSSLPNSNYKIFCWRSELVYCYYNFMVNFQRDINTFVSTTFYKSSNMNVVSLCIRKLSIGVSRSIVLNYCVYVLYIIQIMSLFYYVSLRSEFLVMMSVTISA
jgi:hypothetical protein